MSSSSTRWRWFCGLLICILVAILAVRGMAFSPYEYQGAWFWLFVMSFVMGIVALREAWWKSFPSKYKPWVWLSLFLISIVVGIVAMYEETSHYEYWIGSFVLVISVVVGLIALGFAIASGRW